VSASRAVVAADLARIGAAFEAADAIRTTADGFAYIDETRAPRALVAAYRRLLIYAYANGLMPTTEPDSDPADRSTT
jgi:hypothetical protein